MAGTTFTIRHSSGYGSDVVKSDTPVLCLRFAEGLTRLRHAQHACEHHLSACNVHHCKPGRGQFMASTLCFDTGSPHKGTVTGIFLTFRRKGFYGGLCDWQYSNWTVHGHPFLCVTLSGTLTADHKYIQCPLQGMYVGCKSRGLLSVSTHPPVPLP